MNYRSARRLATRRLAQAARDLGVAVQTQMALADVLTDADKARLVRAFADLARELDIRVGDAERGKRSQPVDPMQEMLFNPTREDEDRGQEADSPAAGR